MAVAMTMLTELSGERRIRLLEALLSLPLSSLRRKQENERQPPTWQLLPWNVPCTECG